MPFKKMDPGFRRGDELISFLNGPFPPLLHQPRICEPTHQLGEFLRYHTSLGQRLSEFAILIVARHWDCDFEWYQHAAAAQRSIC